MPAVNMLGMYHGSFANQVSLYLIFAHTPKGVESVAAMSIASLAHAYDAWTSRICTILSILVCAIIEQSFPCSTFF
jgi:hypothetical protein